MFKLIPANDRQVLAFKVSGKLTDADYTAFVPELEKYIRQTGRISLYIELEDFRGWEARAAWDDLRFGLRHDRDFRRIAVVGDRTWEHAAIALANIFMQADMRFFGRDESQAAWDWLAGEPREQQAAGSVTPYRKLLLATDFSPDSERAARRALELARLYGAELEVLHVIEETVFYTEMSEPLIADIPFHDDSLMERALSRMDTFAGLTGMGKEVAREVLWGVPKHSIISRAREKEMDLIVMGSHGHRGIERLLGSVSNSVLHAAPCDVLIVRP